MRVSKPAAAAMVSVAPLALGRGALGVPGYSTGNATMKALTKEMLAALLDGREIGDEITEDEAEAAKAAGLVVVYGASDDLCEMTGAIEEEYSGNDTLIFVNGKFHKSEDIEEDKAVLEKYGLRVSEGKYISPDWGQDEEFYWSYSTNIPHATFRIYEDGEGCYCKGIVFALSDAK